MLGAHAKNAGHAGVFSLSEERLFELLEQQPHDLAR